MLDRCFVCEQSESQTAIRMNVLVNDCVGAVDLANQIRFNRLNIYLANGIATTFAISDVMRHGSLRGICLQATRAHFHTETGSNESVECSF